MRKLLRRIFSGWRRPEPTHMWDTGVPPAVWVQGPDAVEKWKAEQREVKR